MLLVIFIDRMAWYNLELEEAVNRLFPFLHTRAKLEISFHVG